MARGRGRGAALTPRLAELGSYTLAGNPRSPIVEACRAARPPGRFDRLAANPAG